MGAPDAGLLQIGEKMSNDPLVSVPLASSCSQCAGDWRSHSSLMKNRHTHTHTPAHTRADAHVSMCEALPERGFVPCLACQTPKDVASNSPYVVKDLFSARTDAALVRKCAVISSSSKAIQVERLVNDREVAGIVSSQASARLCRPWQKCLPS